ncbi:MAG: hypothetical protein E6Q88_15180 [Lysobacteraceae bacterium]|nr:MAG: hypothetical protein E6Q88_15180 [Xanthomonadaceae bacterium]
MSLDPRIDAYIANSAEFARPILIHLRQIVRTACPDAEETIKWGMPHFLYRGKILCSMAAFKQHCAFGLWRGAEVIEQASDEAMGQFGRIASVRDLPGKKILAGYLGQGMRAIGQALDEAMAAPARKAAFKTRKPELPVPDDLAARLAKHRKARETFDSFPPSHRREYIEWIIGAKREDTRARRLAQTIEWLAEGKSRNWKYSGC